MNKDKKMFSLRNCDEKSKLEENMPERSNEDASSKRIYKSSYSRLREGNYRREEVISKKINESFTEKQIKMNSSSRVWHDRSRQDDVSLKAKHDTVHKMIDRTKFCIEMNDKKRFSNKADHKKNQKESFWREHDHLRTKDNTNAKTESNYNDSTKLKLTATVSKHKIKYKNSSENWNFYKEITKKEAVEKQFNGRKDIRPNNLNKHLQVAHGSNDFSEYRQNHNIKSNLTSRDRNLMPYKAKVYHSNANKRQFEVCRSVESNTYKPLVINDPVEEKVNRGISKLTKSDFSNTFMATDKEHRVSSISQFRSMKQNSEKITRSKEEVRVEKTPEKKIYSLKIIDEKNLEFDRTLNLNAKTKSEEQVRKKGQPKEGASLTPYQETNYFKPEDKIVPTGKKDPRAELIKLNKTQLIEMTKPTKTESKNSFDKYETQSSCNFKESILKTNEAGLPPQLMIDKEESKIKRFEVFQNSGTEEKVFGKNITSKKKKLLNNKSLFKFTPLSVSNEVLLKGLLKQEVKTTSDNKKISAECQTKKDVEERTFNTQLQDISEPLKEKDLLTQHLLESNISENQTTKQCQGNTNKNETFEDILERTINYLQSTVIPKQKKKSKFKKTKKNVKRVANKVKQLIQIKEEAFKKNYFVNSKINENNNIPERNAKRISRLLSAEEIATRKSNTCFFKEHCGNAKQNELNLTDSKKMQLDEISLNKITDENINTRVPLLDLEASLICSDQEAVKDSSKNFENNESTIEIPDTLQPEQCSQVYIQHTKNNLEKEEKSFTANKVKQGLLKMNSQPCPKTEDNLVKNKDPMKNNPEIKSMNESYREKNIEENEIIDIPIEIKDECALLMSIGHSKENVSKMQELKNNPKENCSDTSIRYNLNEIERIIQEDPVLKDLYDKMEASLSKIDFDVHKKKTLSVETIPDDCSFVTSNVPCVGYSQPKADEEIVANYLFKKRESTETNTKSEPSPLKISGHNTNNCNSQISSDENYLESSKLIVVDHLQNFSQKKDNIQDIIHKDDLVHKEDQVDDFIHNEDQIQATIHKEDYVQEIINKVDHVRDAINKVVNGLDIIKVDHVKNLNQKVDLVQNKIIHVQDNIHKGELVQDTFNTVSAVTCPLRSDQFNVQVSFNNCGEDIWKDKNVDQYYEDTQIKPALKHNSKETQQNTTSTSGINDSNLKGSCVSKEEVLSEIKNLEELKSQRETFSKITSLNRTVDENKKDTSIQDSNSDNNIEKEPMKIINTSSCVSSVTTTSSGHSTNCQSQGSNELKKKKQDILKKTELRNEERRIKKVILKTKDLQITKMISVPDKTPAEVVPDNNPHFQRKINVPVNKSDAQTRKENIHICPRKITVPVDNNQARNENVQISPSKLSVPVNKIDIQALKENVHILPRFATLLGKKPDIQASWIGNAPMFLSSALYDPRAQCVAIPPPSTMSRGAQQSQRAMSSHSGAYSVHQSQSMGPAVRYPAHTYAAHPYIRHQGLPRPPPTYHQHTRATNIQANQDQYHQQQEILKLQQQLQIETNHPALKVAIVPNGKPSYRQSSTNNQTILPAVNNDIESRIEQIKKKNDQKQYNISSTDRARGNGKRRGTNCKDGMTRNGAGRRNRALSNNVERITSNGANSESSDSANIVTNHGYSYSGVNPQYSSSESTPTNSSAVDNNMHMYSNARVNVQYSNSENPAANVSPSNTGTNSSPISAVNGYYASPCPTSNPVHHNVPATAYQTNVNSGINIRQNPYAPVQSNISSQPCGQPCSSQISRPNCEIRENVDNSGSDNINSHQSFQQVVTAQQPAVRQCHPTNVVGGHVPSSYSPQNIVPGNIPSNTIPISPLDSQLESPPSGSRNDSIIGHLVLNPPEWIDDLDDAILIYIAFNIIEPFDIHSKNFYQTTNELYKKQGKNMPFSDWAPISTSLPQIDLTITPDRPIIKAKPLSEMLEQRPVTNDGSKNAVDNVSNQAARTTSHVTDASALLDFSDDLANDNTLTLYSNKGVRNVKTSTLACKEIICVDSNKDEVNVCPSNQNEITLCPSNQNEITLCPSNQNEITLCPSNQNEITLCPSNQNEITLCPSNQNEITLCPSNQNEITLCPSNQNEITLCPSNQNEVNVCLSNQNKDTSKNSQKGQEDSPELPSEPANEPATTNSSSQINLTTKAFKSDDVICLDDESSNECIELKECPSNNQRNGCITNESRYVQVVSEEPIAVNEINKTSTPQVIVKPKASKLKRKNEGSDNSEGKLKKKGSFNENKHSQKEFDKESDTKRNNKIILVIKKKKTKNKNRDLDSTLTNPKNLPFITEISNTNKSDISITNLDSVSSKNVVSNNDLLPVDNKNLGSYVIIHNAAIVKSNTLDSNNKKHENDKILDTKLTSSLVVKPDELSKRNEKITEISNINHLDISTTHIDSVTSKEGVSNNDLSQDGKKNLSSYVIIHKAAIAKSNTFDSNVKKHKNNQILDTKHAKFNESYKRKENILTSCNSVKVIKQPYLEKPSSKMLVEIDMFKEQDCYKHSTSYYLKKYKIKKCSIAIERLTIETLQQNNIDIDEIFKKFPKLALSLTSSTNENQKTLLEANDEFSSTTFSSIKNINEDNAVVEQSEMIKCKKHSEAKKEENQVKEEIQTSTSCDDLIRILGGDEEDDFNKKAHRCLNSEKNLVNNNFLDKIVVEPLHKNEKLSNSASDKAKIDKLLNKIESPKITETLSIINRNKTYDAARIKSKRRSSDKTRKHLSKTAIIEHDEDFDSNTSSNTNSKLSEANKRRVSSEENESFNSVKKERRPSLEKNISSDKCSNSLKNEKKRSASKNIGSVVDKGYSTPKNERRQSSEKKIGFDGDKKHNYINNERRQSLEKMSSSDSNQRQSAEKNITVNGKSYISSNKERRQSSENKISLDSDKIPSSYKNKKRQNLENQINSHSDSSYNFSKNKIAQNIKKKKNLETTKLFTFTSSDKPIKHNTKKNSRTPSEIKCFESTDIKKSVTPNVKHSLLNLPKTLKRTRSVAELCSRSDDNIKSSPRSPNKRPIKKRRKSENDKDLSLFVHIDKKAMKNDLATFSNNTNLPVFSPKKAESDSINDNPSGHSDKLVNNFHRSELPNKETHLSLSGQETDNRPHGSTSNNTHPTETIIDNKSPTRSTNLNDEIVGLSSTNSKVNNHKLNETVVNANEDDIINNILSYIDSCVKEEVSDPRLKAPTYCGFDSKLLQSNINCMNSSDFTESYQATQRFMRENKSYTIPDIQNCTCYQCNRQFVSPKDWRSHVCTPQHHVML